ncbi:MAG: response regulator [Spirochaetae bacterium HGW-Spirochaetae-3]|jgi:DNA-binding response OmpR family regulator|nr:MAG: response regulator [Spirochaetae bacterium HGW-Spirochaetae-3]
MPKASVLIIDESDLFRDYLKLRLTRAGLEAEVAINGLDGISKMRNTPPDLIVMDYHLTRKTCKEVLEEKARNPNTAAIPVVLTAQKIDKNRLLELVQYNIRKVFMKPIKMDAFYQILSEISGARFEVDKTPCIVEAHVNDNIVFVELAKGINLEKVDLLRFKIRELLDLYAIQKPRVLLMLSDMELSFIDGPNLEALLETVAQASKARAKHIKVLTRSAFVKEFVSGRPEFAEIEVVANLEYALEGLIAEAARAADAPEEKAAIITDRILSTQGSASGGETVEMRFDSENARPRLSIESAKHLGDGLAIAVVDDDFVIQELLKTTFEAINAKVSTFSNGREFLSAVRTRVFDLVFLDLRMPEVDGFGVLAELRAQDLDMPIIVLSAVTQRESVVKAFKAGVKSYLVKPLKPEQILRKTLEILKANF